MISSRPSVHRLGHGLRRPQVPALKERPRVAVGRLPAWIPHVLIQGVQAGVTRPQDLRSALRRRGQCHYLAVLHETVGDLEGGVRSLPEQRFAALVRRAGLPEPARRVVVRSPDGRHHLDADWPDADVSAEVHGVHHAHAAQPEHDWRRHNDLTVLTHRKVLHFTSHQVRTRPDEVAAVLAAALGRPDGSASLGAGR